MSSDDLFGAPAGWYPDPLGLPQLRWWNNHAWTEQTSAARQPMVVQDTKFAWADEELPSRREERERERQRDDRKTVDDVAPTVDALRELDPPRATAVIGETRAPAAPAAAAEQPQQAAPAAFTPPAAQQESAQPAQAQQTQAQQAPAQPLTVPVEQSLYTPDPIVEPTAATTSFGSLFDGVAPSTAAPSASTESLDALFGAESATRRGQKRTAPMLPQEPIGGVPVTANKRLPSGTGPAWIIAMIPLFQLVLSLLFLTALDLGSNFGLFISILVVPYFIVVALAYFDQRMLLAAGHERPAHWAWAFLTAPVYLLVRARSAIRQTGHGIGPVLVWFGLGLLHVVSVFAVPGLLIALLPAVFSTQIEESVVRDAALMGGATLSVSCPDTPPLLPGQEIVCKSVSASGSNMNVTVTLDRVNGWIGWPVTDWGVFGTTTADDTAAE